LRNQCRELFKQELNTKEEAKKRDSTRRKRFKLIETRWKHFHHVPTVKKTNHQLIKCWWRPDFTCRKCGKIGHVERICRSQQHEKKANPVA
jgi:hypothetical protein